MSELAANLRSDPRGRLLTAAGPVFAARGFERATLREISSAADVNVAAVAYYFGDKMGLYREVIGQVRQSRDRRFPAPNNTEQDQPRVALARLIRTMLSRMLNCDEPSWESQLLMREMNDPTPVFAEMVNDFFRPLFNQLLGTLDRLIQEHDPKISIPAETLEQLALSAVGQCLYYRVGRGVVDILIPKQRRDEHFDIDSLSLHITSVMISATKHATVLKEKRELESLLGHEGESRSPSHSSELEASSRVTPKNE